MTEIEIIQETPLTLEELKTKLDTVKKRDKELSFRANKTSEYLSGVVGKKSKDDLKKKIQELDISRLKDRQIVKVVDIQPQDAESLRALFAGENLTLKQEDLNRILECLK
jgi:DNA-directed RNA polymerase subunit F